MKLLKRPEKIREWQFVFGANMPTLQHFDYWAREISLGIFRINYDNPPSEGTNIWGWIKRGFYISFILKSLLSFISL
jgi:hypothetical protein